MNFLVDTHILIWAAANDLRLSRVARDILSSSEHQIFASTVSIWEIAIKRSKNLLSMAVSTTDFVELCVQNDFPVLPFTARHAAAVEFLPLVHADPFDRALIAKAKLEGFRFLTHDELLQEYGSFVELV